MPRSIFSYVADPGETPNTAITAVDLSLLMKEDREGEERPVFGPLLKAAFRAGANHCKALDEAGNTDLADINQGTIQTGLYQNMPQITDGVYRVDLGGSTITINMSGDGERMLVLEETDGKVTQSCLTLKPYEYFAERPAQEGDPDYVVQDMPQFEPFDYRAAQPDMGEMNTPHNDI